MVHVITLVLGIWHKRINSSKKKKVLGTEAHAYKLQELRQEDPWVRPAWTTREFPENLSNKLRLSLKKQKVQSKNPIKISKKSKGNIHLKAIKIFKPLRTENSKILDTQLDRNKMK